MHFNAFFRVKNIRAVRGAAVQCRPLVVTQRDSNIPSTGPGRPRTSFWLWPSLFACWACTYTRRRSGGTRLFHKESAGEYPHRARTAHAPRQVFKQLLQELVYGKRSCRWYLLGSEALPFPLLALDERVYGTTPVPAPCMHRARTASDTPPVTTIRRASPTPLSAIFAASSPSSSLLQ